MATAILTTIPGTPDGIILITPAIAIIQYIITRFIIQFIIPTRVTTEEDIMPETIIVTKPGQVMCQDYEIRVIEVIVIEEGIHSEIQH